MLVPLTFPPGLFRTGTEYQAKGRWTLANLVRWFAGAMQPVGGWVLLRDQISDLQFTVGTFPRAATAWKGGDGTPWLAVGTTTKLYAFASGRQYDITPTGLTVAGSVPTYSTGGYGNSLYSLNPYGVTTTSYGVVTPPGTWSLDVFGEFLVGVLSSDKRLMVWPKNTALLAAPASGAPTCNAVVVTAERFVVALGAGSDARRVAWATQETTTDWTPTTVNSAGGTNISSEGTLLAGRRVRGETLLFTDCDVHAMRYVGGTFIFQIDRIGTGCGLIGPNAVGVVDGVAYWMGANSFFTSRGFVQPVPCDVTDAVFEDLNQANQNKIACVPNTAYGEIWWFYPSKAATENDRYVVYNYRENHWTTGTLSRACGVDQGVFPQPIWIRQDGKLAQHETGNERPADEVITPYAESGPLEIGDGEYVGMVTELLPDEKAQGGVRLYLYGRMYPNGPETQLGPYTLANPTSVRMTARQLRLRVEEVAQTDWRVGTQRLTVFQGGKR